MKQADPLAELQDESKRRRAFFSFLLQVLQEVPAYSRLVELLLEKTQEFFQADQAALFLQKREGLHVELALGFSPTTPTKLLPLCEQTLLSGVPVHGEDLVFFPLFFREDQATDKSEEILPLGVLALSESSMKEAGFLHEFLDFAAELIMRQKRREETLSQLEKTSSRLYFSKQAYSIQERSQPHSDAFAGIIGGRAPAMAAVFQLLEKIIPSHVPVLIQGESGTGKELIARTIHEQGERAEKAFVPISCAALSPQLFESELFGHVKGAFTGAVKEHQGLLEKANGGTVFLDEVAALPLPIQAKLLRVLQQGEIQPVGATATKQIHIRVIASTQRELEKEIEKGLFRKDLFYRLNVILLEVPALRERVEDIPLLVGHFLGKLTKSKKQARRSITPQALKALTYSAWPGNVRELQNVLESLLSLHPKGKIDLKHLPAKLQVQEESKPHSFEQAKGDFYRQYLSELLEKTGGNVIEAAQKAEIDRTHFYRLMRKHLSG